MTNREPEKPRTNHPRLSKVILDPVPLRYNPLTHAPSSEPPPPHLPHRRRAHLPSLRQRLPIPKLHPGTITFRPARSRPDPTDVWRTFRFIYSAPRGCCVSERIPRRSMHPVVKRPGHEVEVRESTIHITPNTNPKARHARMTSAKSPDHVIPNPNVDSLPIKNELSPRARCSAVVVSTGVELTLATGDRSVVSDRETANKTTERTTAKRRKVSKAAFIRVLLPVA